MIRWLFAYAMVVPICLALAGSPVVAEEARIVAPKPGDRVVVYTNRFKPEDFEAARKIMVDGFTDAMEDHGESRLTIFIASEETSEILGISIFLNETDAEKWHDHPPRVDVVKALDAMRREPLIVKEFRPLEAHEVP